VVAEEFESSIEIFTRVLEKFHVPPNVIEAQAKVLRGDSYLRLRGPRGSGRVSDAVLEVLAAGTTTVYYVTEGSPAAGATIAELDLRRRTGATIIAVVHGETPRTNPPPDHRIVAGESLVLVGSHSEISAAFDLLEGGREETAPSPSPS
jgi:CPA2 family monovalent cation:H+ antiporter-2